MPALTATRLLDLWEEMQEQSPADQALTLLAAVNPELSLDTLLQAPIGYRNHQLLSLRAEQFGQHLDVVTNCPACGELLEFTLFTPDLLVSQPNPTNPTRQISADGYTVAFRLPNSADLLTLESARGWRIDQGRKLANHAPAESRASASPHSHDDDPKKLRTILLNRCIDALHCPQAALAAAEVPEWLAGLVEAAMAEADPQADLLLYQSCPACSHGWESHFDPMGYLWLELHQWAHRTLADVHRLATVYGWSESEILALRPWRRQHYLELTGV